MSRFKPAGNSDVECKRTTAEIASGLFDGSIKGGNVSGVLEGPGGADAGLEMRLKVLHYG